MGRGTSPINTAPATIVDCIRSILAELSPNEERYVDMLWSVYVRNPALLATPARSRIDHPLGSGFPIELTTWVITLITALGSAAVSIVAELALKETHRRGSAWIHRLLQGRRERRQRRDLGRRPVSTWLDGDMLERLYVQIREPIAAAGYSEADQDKVIQILRTTLKDGSE